MKTKNSKLQKNKKPNNGTSQLIGVKSFSRNGLQTDGHGEPAFYLVRPTNISVLSQTCIAVKVRHLMQLLTAQPDIEICCLDDQECFDGNKEYFYDAAEGLLTATILLIAELCPPEQRHIVSVFKVIQELLAPTKVKGKNQFQLIIEKLPPEHKAKWFAGAALNTVNT